MKTHPLNEKTLKEYRELRKEYSENECQLYFGGFEGLRQIIREGQLNDLWSWLTGPTEDWQKDC